MVTNTDKTMKVKEELIERKLRKGALNSDQEYILERKVAGKDCLDPHEKTREEFEILLNSPIREDGGRNALFGFYYQFLVAIDYLIELIEGKWSFMAFEIHDDIVLCKEEGNQSIVRFVQVKTSKTPSKLYTKTELCNRTNKKFTFGVKKESLSINDSWLDKLFLNGELFKSRKEVIQQFQLITNFSFYVPQAPKGAKTKDINHYRKNESFLGIDIREDDPFFQKLNNPVFNADGDEYDYDSQLGMSIQDFLSKTHISERSDTLGSYRDAIRTRFGDMLSRDVKTQGGATILDEDINWIIGEMIASCSARDDKLVLFIDRERAMYFKRKLLEKAGKYSEEFNGVLGNKKYINEAFEKVIQEIQTSHPEALNYFEQIAVSVKQQFYHWIEKEEGNVLQLIGRLFEGREELIDFHVKMHKSTREESVYSLVVILLLLNITNKEINFSLKHRSTVTKEVLNYLEEEYYLTLLKIEDNYYYKEVVGKLNEIVASLQASSHADLLLMTLGTPNKIIIHGKHDGSDTARFDESGVEVVTLEGPLIPQLGGKSDSMARVNSYKFLLIPWSAIESKYARFRKDKDDFAEFKETLTELWNKLSKAGEE